MLVVLILFYTLLGLAVHEGFRRYPKSSWAFFLVLPLALTPAWFITQPDTDWFFWAKIYSILAGTWLILAIRTTEIKHKQWPFYLAYAVAIINLLEAITKAFITDWTIPNLLIGFSGILLIVLLPKPNSIKVDNDFLWATPYSWIIGYTIWDWVLIYLVYPNDAAAHLALLAAPLIAALRNPKLYMQARACTLSFYLIGAVTIPKTLEIVQIPIFVHHDWIALIGALIAATWLAIASLKRII